MRIIILTVLLILPMRELISQTQVDGIIAWVGSNIILRSDVEVEYQQLAETFQGMRKDSALGIVLNKILTEKLMLLKAQTDSIEIPDERVEGELDKRIRFYIQKFGSERAMEEYLGKSVQQLKFEYREKVRNQMKVQEIQQTLFKDVRVTPTEIRRFFQSIPKDSLPFYSAEAEVGVIVRFPKVTPEEDLYAYEKIKEIREDIIAGRKTFERMAILYSQDPGSSTRGGILDYFGRNEMVPEFEAMAFKLKHDSVSKIVKTKFGYHILKLIDRKGERVSVRHILIKPQTLPSDLQLASRYLDSIINLIIIDSIKFEQAAKKYNDDMDNMKASGGFFTDPSTGSTQVSMEDLDKNIYFAIETLKPGEISKPQPFVSQDQQNSGYRIVFLKSYSAPHTANLTDDYQKIQQAALEKKKQEALENWIISYKKDSFVKIHQDWINLPGLLNWKNQ